MNYPVLVNFRCEHVARVRDAVQTFNRLQPYFDLDLVRLPWLPNDPNEEDEVSSDDILDLLIKRKAPFPNIVVIQNPRLTAAAKVEIGRVLERERVIEKPVSSAVQRNVRWNAR